WECGAMALTLTDRFPEKGLAPAIDSPDRAAYYQWVVFAFATELFALSKIAMHTRFLPPPMQVAAIAEDGRQAWPAVAKVIGDATRGKSWLVGDRFSTADVVVGGTLWLANLVGVLADYPDAMAYFRRVEARPAFKKAFSDAT